MSSVPDAPPPIPTELQVYNSYAVDPIWQRKFSVIWAAAVGVCILVSLPHLFKSLRNGRTWAGASGVWEHAPGKAHYEVMPAQNEGSARQRADAPRNSTFRGLRSSVASVVLWTVPHIGLDVGRIVVIVGYFITLLLCITTQAELIDNPNRAGFMTLAQFPVVFLLATKNSLLSLALGPGHGWENLNYIHRWAGRGMFLSATVHGSLWIRNHIQYGLPILGQQKETSGVAAFGVLCVIVLSSLKPVRVWAYQFFFVVHVLAFVAFYITVCYHTIYAMPWLLPPLAFYGLDLLVRMLRHRIKDATLITCDDQMTLIHVHDCDGGWVAGQHVRLRVFFSGRVFESHPLTIASAPSKTTCLSGGTLLLGARATGDWTRALNAYARNNATPMVAGDKLADVSGSGNEKAAMPENYGTQVQVMIDGPYGGSSVDLGEYESVLLVAGGSGATFSLGMLDDIVGRCLKLGRRGGERTRRIEFAWCVKSFGCIEWFAPMLMEIAHATANSSIDLHISVFVTCICNPDAVPAIPNSDVTIERPTVRRMLRDLVAPDACAPEEDVAAASRKNERCALSGGGLAVCAAGPETLTRETRNAVAGFALTSGRQVGGVACHTEVYSI